jgi:rhodanese-related sulfurtransferase
MPAGAASETLSASGLLQDLRHAEGELALLDVREEGRFARGHILVATSLPLSRLERDIGRLVPRRTCRVVVCDDEDGIAATAQIRLRRLGYRDVVRLDGGVAAWAAAGGELFQGLNTPSKVLGAYMHDHLGIPEISPVALAQARQERAVHIVDCRPAAEFARGSIPGAANCPGVELVRQLPALAAMPEELLVIHCAGRTRGLAGAQMLIDFGYPGKVAALRNGTMGWELCGHELERGAGHRLQSETAAGDGARKTAERLRQRLAIELLDKADLARWRADPARTTYLFDIRQQAEYETGHVPGARHVEGGQLIQNLDMHVATRGARIVLADDDGVRATATALWLRRMGWRDLAIVMTPLMGPLESGRETSAGIPTPTDVATVTAPELKDLLDKGNTLLIDLGTSRDYRSGHIPAAWFVTRSRLAKVLDSLPNADTLVLTSPDGIVAALASKDELRFHGPIRVLEGGTEAWRRAGYPLSRGLERLADEPDDVVLKPSELTGGRKEAMREYLSVPEDLLDRVQRDGTLRLAALPQEH